MNEGLQLLCFFSLSNVEMNYSLMRLIFFWMSWSPTVRKEKLYIYLIHCHFNDISITSTWLSDVYVYVDSRGADTWSMRHGCLWERERERDGVFFFSELHFRSNFSVGFRKKNQIISWLCMLSEVDQDLFIFFIFFFFFFFHRVTQPCFEVSNTLRPTDGKWLVARLALFYGTRCLGLSLALPAFRHLSFRNWIVQPFLQQLSCQYQWKDLGLSKMAQHRTVSSSRYYELKPEAPNDLLGIRSFFWKKDL